MTAHRERIFSRPNRLDDFKARILPVGVNSNQTATGPQRPRQRRNNPLGAEIHRRFGPVWLGCNHKVEISLGSACPRDDRIEQETVVLPIYDQRYRPFIGRHARFWADIGAPVLLEKWAKFSDLGLELARRRPLQ